MSCATCVLSGIRTAAVGAHSRGRRKIVFEAFSRGVVPISPESRLRYAIQPLRAMRFWLYVLREIYARVARCDQSLSLPLLHRHPTRLYDPAQHEALGSGCSGAWSPFTRYGPGYLRSSAASFRVHMRSSSCAAMPCRARSRQSKNAANPRRWLRFRGEVLRHCTAVTHRADCIRPSE